MYIFLFLRRGIRRTTWNVSSADRCGCWASPALNTNHEPCGWNPRRIQSDTARHLPFFQQDEIKTSGGFDATILQFFYLWIRIFFFFFHLLAFDGELGNLGSPRFTTSRTSSHNDAFNVTFGTLICSARQFHSGRNDFWIRILGWRNEKSTLGIDSKWCMMPFQICKVCFCVCVIQKLCWQQCLCICSFCAFTCNLSQCVLKVRDNKLHKQPYRHGQLECDLHLSKLQPLAEMKYTTAASLTCLCLFQNDRCANQTKESIVTERVGVIVRGQWADNQGHVVTQRPWSLFQGRNTHCCFEVSTYCKYESFTLLLLPLLPRDKWQLYCHHSLKSTTSEPGLARQLTAAAFFYVIIISIFISVKKHL